MTIRVLVVDDESLVRAGLIALLDSEPDIDVVGEAADGAEAVELAGRSQPDVVLLDIRMPGMDGLAATARLGDLDPAPRVVMLTTFDLDEYVVEALRGGASGFMLKSSPPADLLTAVRVAARGEAIIAPSATQRLIERFIASADGAPGALRPEALQRLTGRERDVLGLLARGLSNRELAASLHVSEATVKTHVSSILSKLGLSTRVQAVIAAYESGLVRPRNGR